MRYSSSSSSSSYHDKKRCWYRRCFGKNNNRKKSFCSLKCIIYCLIILYLILMVLIYWTSFQQVGIIQSDTFQYDNDNNHRHHRHHHHRHHFIKNTTTTAAAAMMTTKNQGIFTTTTRATMETSTITTNQRMDLPFCPLSRHQVDDEKEHDMVHRTDDESEFLSLPFPVFSPLEYQFVWDDNGKTTKTKTKLKTIQLPLSVGLVTKSSKNKKPEFSLTTKHILLDGIIRSSALNLTVICALNEINYNNNDRNNKNKNFIEQDEVRDEFHNTTYDNEKNDDDDEKIDRGMTNLCLPSTRTRTTRMMTTNDNDTTATTTRNKIDLWIFDLVKLRTIENIFLNHPLTNHLLLLENDENDNNHDHNNNDDNHNDNLPQILLIDYTDEINYKQPKFFTKKLNIPFIKNGTTTTTTTNYHQRRRQQQEQGKEELGQEQQQKYNNINKNNKNNIRLALSSIVQGRHFVKEQVGQATMIDDETNEEKEQNYNHHDKRRNGHIELGTIIPLVRNNNNYHNYYHSSSSATSSLSTSSSLWSVGGGPILHSPYTVRSDIFDAIVDVLKNRRNKGKRKQQGQSYDKNDQFAATSTGTSTTIKEEEETKINNLMTMNHATISQSETTTTTTTTNNNNNKYKINYCYQENDYLFDLYDYNERNYREKQMMMIMNSNTTTSKNKSSSSSLYSDVTTTTATDDIIGTDVIHFWEASSSSSSSNAGTTTTESIAKHAARYRDLVSVTVNSMNGLPITIKVPATTTATRRRKIASSLSDVDDNENKNIVMQQQHEEGQGHKEESIVVQLRTSTKIQGTKGYTGRTGVNENYVTALLSTKIVIVTQRDKWEDHYRFMEGLISGAMVLSDVMLSFSDNENDNHFGNASSPSSNYSPSSSLLRNGTHFVMFRNMDELRYMIKYYISHPRERQMIANQGFQIAINHHRSWHRLEDLIFGCHTTSSTTTATATTTTTTSTNAYTHNEYYDDKNVDERSDCIDNHRKGNDKNMWGSFVS